MAILSETELKAALADLPDWSHDPERAGIARGFRFPDFSFAIAFMFKASLEAEKANAESIENRVKAVLNPGTRIELAAADFRTAEEFMTVAHAARNTKVPFMVLKHRVLTEGQSLEDAIRASKPDIDARTEALRARGEARADILTLTMGNTATSEGGQN